QTTLVQVHEAMGGGMRVRGWEPVCGYARRLAGLQRKDESLPGWSFVGEDFRGQEIEQVPIQPGRLHEAGQHGLLSLDVSELVGEVVTLHRALFTGFVASSKISKAERF